MGALGPPRAGLLAGTLQHALSIQPAVQEAPAYSPASWRAGRTIWPAGVNAVSRPPAYGGMCVGPCIGSRIGIHKDQIGSLCPWIALETSRRMAALAKQEGRGRDSRCGPTRAAHRSALGAENFRGYWVSGVTAAMSHRPPGCPTAIADGALGFAYDATARGSSGPTGVAMTARVYACESIGSPGAHELCAGAVGAVPVEADGEDLYQGLLRDKHDPGPGQY